VRRHATSRCDGGGISGDDENEEVLAYLRTEQLESWKESTSPWIVEGYALTTHPDLCERVEQINAALGGVTEMRYLFGKPALLTQDGIIIAFATGTYVFCVRLRREDCAPELIGERREPLSRFPVLRRKQLELDALTAEKWTRLDPWANDVVRQVEKAVDLL
jgi:hypothetical protein